MWKVFEILRPLILNRIFHNVEKGTGESAAYSDSIGNSTKSVTLPPCGSVAFAYKLELFFNFFAHFNSFATLVYHGKCFLWII